MEFKVEKYYKENFTELLEKTCKKFKVDFTVEWSEEKEIGTRTTIVESFEDFDFGGFASWGNGGQKSQKTPIMGYIATVEVPEIEKMEDPDFTYLGCIKNEDMVTVHPTGYADEKGIKLNEMKEEIESFPCADCGKKIARKIIHVFETNATGEIAVYGSGCAVKRFGINFTQVMDKFYNALRVINEYYDDEEGCFGGGGWGRKVEDARYFTFLTFFNIYSHGYTSGSAAWTDGGTSTKDDVYNDLYILRGGKDKDRNALIAAIDDFKEIHEDRMDYDEFVAWLPEFKETLKDDDFGFNMTNVADMIISDNEIADRMAGYAVYMIFRYWQDKMIPKAPKEEWNTDYSNFKIGDKVKDFGPITVQIVGVYSYETQYGMKYIYTMRDLKDGYKFKWFATVWLDEALNHEIYSGTIKDLEDHEKYGKAIVLTRCRANTIYEEETA